jgi:predicted nucleotidyltransferase
MGHKLTRQQKASLLIRPLPPWLDMATRTLVEDIIHTLTEQRPDVLAIILYGSIARHDERPVDDATPSDVDLLVVFDTDDELLTVHQGKELFQILGHAYNRHLDVLRDVKAMFASRMLSEWDETFIGNVMQDGILLWLRDSLPTPLAAMAERGASTACEDPADNSTKRASAI